MAAATWQQRNPGQNPSYDYQDELRKSGMTYGQPQRGMMVDYYNQQNRVQISYHIQMPTQNYP